MTDLDHEFNRATFEHALAAKNPGRTIYKLRRVMGDGAGHHPHPNTFFLSRARFLRFHGYDEEFAGHYGFDDSMFWRWQRYHGTRFRMLPRRCHIQHRGTVRDEDYKSIRRDLAHNRVLATQKREAWRRVGPAAGHSRRFLAFTWDIAEDRVRSTRPPSPPPRPLWVKTWWWRWLLG
jgi:hypothetical protein